MMFYSMMKELDEIKLDIRKKNMRIKELEYVLSAIQKWYENSQYIKEMDYKQKQITDIFFNKAKELLGEK